MQIDFLKYNSHLLITSPKIHTDLLWDLSFLFVGLAVIYFTAVFFFRNTISSKSEKVKKKKRELSPMISEFLFHEDDATKDEKSEYVQLKIEIRELLKNEFNRKVLTEILLDLRKDVSGETLKRLFELYQDLGLHQDAYLKLRSWHWHIVSKGIYELTQMHIDESYGFITKFINDKRTTIRKQAEIATVTLKNEGLSYFLDTTKYRISEWQQLKLLDVVRNQDDFQPPRFRAWLTSSNKHVVLFAIRLIKYYNQNDANTSLIELIKHRNDQIKVEAINCIKEFNVVEALDILKLVFWKSTVDIKISILDAIAELGSKTDLDFLKLIERKESNFYVRSKAISSINFIVPECIMPTLGIEQIRGNQIPDDIVPKPILDLDEDIEEQVEDTLSVCKENIVNDTYDESDSESIIEKVQVKSKETELGIEIEKSNGDTSDDTTYLINLDFLPIVVDMAEKGLPISNAKIDETKTSETEASSDILGIDVLFEEIGQGPEISDKDLSNKETNEAEVAIDDLNISELAFLPFVIDKAYEQENEHTHDDTLHNIIFEFDIKKDSGNSQEPSFSIDISNNEKHADKEPNVVNENSTNDVLDFDLSYEEINASKKEDLKAQDEFIDWPSDEFPIIPLNKEEEEAIEYMSQELQAILDKIPKPKYYDKDTLVTLRLLDDIEELGDQREIPLLEDLFEKTEIIEIKNRIKKIINRFLVEKPQDQSIQDKESNSEEFKPFSIFEDLFRVSDTEGKMILMDEIVTVGDEKEIDFLNGLLEDSDMKIKEKAKLVLEELQKKLFLQDLYFEPSESFIHDSPDGNIVDKNPNSIFNHLRSIPLRIIEILNG